MNLEFDEIEKMMHFFDESSASELRLQTGDVKFVLRKTSLKKDFPSGAVSGEVLPERAADPAKDLQKAKAQVLQRTDPAAGKEATAGMPDPAGQGQEAEEAPQQAGTLVTAPLAGIFYRSPKPGEKPFAEVGTRVKKGQTIALMEAMKIINEVPAPCDGTITEILAADGAFAQFEDPLVRIV